MSRFRIDLSSDTQTRPTPAMRACMANAEVGDEQLRDDPSVNHLCAMVAELLGKEDAIFLPSGTMCNQIAYRVHCQPGDEIVLDESSHSLNYEAGAPAALSGAMTRAIAGKRGVFTADQVREAIRPDLRFHPRSRVLSIENTANLGGGTVWPIESILEVTEVAREHGLATHMDGARLLNAVIASGVSARDYAGPFDSVWIDLSKGLGAPVGAVLAGSSAFIDRAWNFKQQFGGAMRQAGIIAAGGIYALEHHIDRLSEDHANAKRLAELLAMIPGISVDVITVETNMVYFDVASTGVSTKFLSTRLEDRGVRFSVLNDRILRAVTHLDVDRAGVEEAAFLLHEFVDSSPKPLPQ